MNAQTNQRKKALQILLSIFLVFGGLVFVFSIYQGLGDLRDMENKGRFSYGYAMRKAALTTIIITNVTLIASLALLLLMLFP